MKQVRLNRLELWVADHAAPIFIVVAALIVAGAIAITLVFMQAQKAGNQVNVLKPQVTRVNKAICDAQSLNHSQRAERCAERIRVGLVNCRHSNPCRAAFLAIATYPPKARSGSPSSTTAPSSGGGDAFQPSTGHQQPGPSTGPHGGSDEGHGQGSAPSPSPGSPAAPGASAAPEASPTPETPGNGAQGGSTSGAGVEVCALERCTGVEVDLGN